MAKRFTDSEKWEDEWFDQLSNDNKIVWLYLLDSVNHAGFMKINIRQLNFKCQTSHTLETIMELFTNRLVIVQQSYWFIPKFVKFQYDSGLNSSKPVIISVYKELEKYNCLAIIQQSFGNDYLIIKDKDKDKDKSKDKSKSKDNTADEKFIEEFFKGFREMPFEEFRELIGELKTDYKWKDHLIKKFNFNHATDWFEEVPEQFLKFVKRDFYDKDVPVKIDGLNHIKNAAEVHYEIQRAERSKRKR